MNCTHLPLDDLSNGPLSRINPESHKKLSHFLEREYENGMNRHEMNISMSGLPLICIQKSLALFPFALRKVASGHLNFKAS